MKKTKTKIAFRKKALEQLNRPVLVDNVLRVIIPKNWLLVIGLFCMIAGFLTWLILGKIFIQIEGKGLLMSANGEVVTLQGPLQEGVVTEVRVKPGQAVQLNDILIISDNALALQLQSAKAFLKKLSQQAHPSAEVNLQILKEEQAIDLLQKRWDESHMIRSPVNGHVEEVLVKKGDYIKPGAALITIIPPDNDLYTLAFVPAAKGKLLKPGMSVQITPLMIKSLEYGSIKGHIESISTLPVSGETILALLGNQQLVDTFTHQEPQMSVKIKLDKNAKTGNYQWTTRTSPVISLSQGTLVNVIINVDTVSPIELITHTY